MRSVGKYVQAIPDSLCKCKCKCKFNVKYGECLHDHPSQRLMIKCWHPDQIGIWKCWFLKKRENQSTWRKTSRSKDKNQQKTQPTYGTRSGNRTRDTLVGGERSHHCAIPAPQGVLCESLLSDEMTTKCNVQGDQHWYKTSKWTTGLIDKYHLFPYGSL